MTLIRTIKWRWLVAVLLCGGLAGWFCLSQSGGAPADGSLRASARRRIRCDGARAPLARRPALPADEARAERPADTLDECDLPLLLRSFTLDELAALSDTLNESDLPLVLGSLTLDELRLPFGVRLFDRWVQAQPQAATLWAWEREDRNTREALLRSAADRWAEQDEMAAVAWVDSLAPGQESRDLARAIVGASVRESHPLTALRLALELPDDNNSRAPLASAAAAQWAKTDPQAAATWAQTLPSDAFRDRLVGSMASVWAASDAPAALRFVLENLPAGGAQDEAVIAVVQRAGPAAVALPASVSDATLRVTNLPVVVALWTASDPEATGTWLNALPDGPQRDEGIAAHALVLAGREIPTALTWARRITDPALRARSVDRVWGLLR